MHQPLRRTDRRSYTLKINRPKCNFCCMEVRYLGRITTSGGLKPNPGKIAAIQKMPEPRNVKHIQTFSTNVLLVSSIYTPVCRCRQTTQQFNQEGCCLDLGKATTGSLWTIETLTYNGTIVTASRRNEPIRN
jgi:hypothetical protein